MGKNKKAKPKGRELTTKQKRFVELYDGNGVKAAKLAGYTGNADTLSQVSYENLRKPEIADAIRRREQLKLKKGILTREERQTFWSNIALDPSKDIGDRMKASELLGRSEGDFVDRHKIDDLEDLAAVIAESFGKGK